MIAVPDRFGAGTWRLMRGLGLRGGVWGVSVRDSEEAEERVQGPGSRVQDPGLRDEG